MVVGCVCGCGCVCARARKGVIKGSVETSFLVCSVKSDLLSEPQFLCLLEEEQDRFVQSLYYSSRKGQPHIEC